MSVSERLSELERLTALAVGDNAGLSVPCSRYGSRTEHCAPWAVACHLIYLECNGEDGSEDDSLDYLMGLVVNDSEDVAYLLRSYGYCLPSELLEQLDHSVYEEEPEQ